MARPQCAVPTSEYYTPPYSTSYSILWVFQFMCAWFGVITELQYYPETFYLNLILGKKKQIAEVVLKLSLINH